MAGKICIIDEFVKLLYCPISGQIFNTPVINKKDNIVYELQELFNLNKKDNVPTDYIILKSLISFISSFLEKYPEYKKQQYVPKTSYSFVYDFDPNKVLRIMENKNYNDLLNYSYFSVTQFKIQEIWKFLLNANKDVIFHFISNMKNINEEVENVGFISILICACPYNHHHIEFTQYIIENGASMTNLCRLGEENHIYPLYQIVKNVIHEALLRIAITKHLEQGLTLFEKTDIDNSILEAAIGNQPQEIIDYMLNIVSEDVHKHLTKSKMIEHLKLNKHLDGMQKYYFETQFDYLFNNKN